MSRQQQRVLLLLGLLLISVVAMLGCANEVTRIAAPALNQDLAVGGAQARTSAAGSESAK